MAGRRLRHGILCHPADEAREGVALVGDVRIEAPRMLRALAVVVRLEARAVPSRVLHIHVIVGGCGLDDDDEVWGS